MTEGYHLIIPYPCCLHVTLPLFGKIMWMPGGIFFFWKEVVVGGGGNQGMMILGIYYRIKIFFLNRINGTHEWNTIWILWIHRYMDLWIYGFILAYMNADMKGKILHSLIISLKASSFLLSASQVRSVLQLFESQSISHTSP